MLRLDFLQRKMLMLSRCPTLNMSAVTRKVSAAAHLVSHSIFAPHRDSASGPLAYVWIPVVSGAKPPKHSCLCGRCLSQHLSSISLNTQTEAQA